MMDFTRAKSFWDAPFPSDDLRGADGTVDVSGFPNPQNVPLIEQARSLLASNDGFAATGAVFFQISEPIDPAGLPDVAGSAGPDSPAFLIGADPASPDYGVRYPCEVTFEPVGSIYGAPNLVSLLPIQGMPLRPGTKYAAVLTTALKSAGGKALERARDLTMFPDASRALADAEVAQAQIAGVTEFTTGHPTAQLETVRTAALARTAPTIDAPFAKTDDYTDFCAYHTTIGMPDYQAGTPPFNSASDGGAWMFDGSGQPVFQRSETANLVLTLPKRAMPPGGYPLMVFVRTGGGGDRPVVDRGRQAVEGGPPVEPGEGPARYFARAGFAAIEVDGPLGGMRNPTGADEQFLTFNVGNLGAMRDNIRESAIELDVLAHLAVGLHVDGSACTGSGGANVTFDATHVGIMGHSMGSWIEPLAVAAEPMFGVVLMSGAGGSWIENIMYKQKPTPVYEAIATFVHVSELRADDPVMTFSQWALEPADPQVYAHRMDRNVLMMQGIVDDYILPNIANATSLGAGLDLAGPELDTEDDPRLAGEHTLGGLLPLVPLAARQTLALPVRANLASRTAVVTQHHEDGIEDGHEVVFQTDVPKHQYQCFLASWLATGVGTVPTDATRDAPCP